MRHCRWANDEAVYPTYKIWNRACGGRSIRAGRVLPSPRWPLNLVATEFKTSQQLYLGETLSRTFFHLFFLVAFIPYAWWVTTSEDAEHANIPVLLLFAILMFCYEALWCGFDFFRQRCFGATLGCALFFYIVIVLIKRKKRQ